jgi:hypothetical protein
MTHPARLAPARQRVQVTECTYAIGSAVLRHGEAQRVGIAIGIESMQGLMMSGGIPLAPQTAA